tara:strand:- start:273 stop:644 length:372 start_codon:yes stop_codon:yes gene_type:complete
MNEFILKVMRQVDNPALFTALELRISASAAYGVHIENKNSANNFYDADCAASAVAHTAYAQTAYAEDSRIAAYAYPQTAYAEDSRIAAYAYANAPLLRTGIDEYFKVSGKNKQDYIDEVERLR